MLFGLMARACFNIHPSASNYFGYSSVQAPLASAPAAGKTSAAPRSLTRELFGLPRVKAEARASFSSPIKALEHFTAVPKAHFDYGTRNS